jgi:hypothetical protein
MPSATTGKSDTRYTCDKHYEFICYHPMLLFVGEGDFVASKLRPGNVHSAHGRKQLLLPEIKRQQGLGKEE